MFWSHFFNMFKIPSFGHGKRQGRHQRLLRAIRPIVEQFEQRMMLSADPTIAIDTSTVKPNNSVDEGSNFTLDLTPPASRIHGTGNGKSFRVMATP